MKTLCLYLSLAIAFLIAGIGNGVLKQIWEGFTKGKDDLEVDWETLEKYGN